MIFIRKYVPVNLVLHFPKDEEALRALARQKALIHADTVFSSLERLPCSPEQKLALLDAKLQEVKTGRQRDT